MAYMVANLCTSCSRNI